MLQSFSSLILPLLALGRPAWSHGLHDHDARSIEQTLHTSSRRALDGFFVIDESGSSNLGCSEEQISAISGFVSDAQALAFMASAVLAESDSEYSDAYMFWFGAGNAKAATRKAIKESNYDPVQDYLKAPGSNNRVDTNTESLSPTGLTYMCAASDSNLCASGVAAAAHNSGDGVPGHFIVLCQRMFEFGTQQDMLRKWQASRVLQLSAGFTLLHEVQHLAAIVGDNRRCIDVPDPEDGSGCYTASCCSTLKDADKIQNAQNMAFFALEVMADPESGAAPGQQCTIMKRGAANALMGGYEYLLARDAEDSSPEQEYNERLRFWARAASTMRTSVRSNATADLASHNTTAGPASRVATPMVPVPTNRPSRQPSASGTNRPASSRPATGGQQPASTTASASSEPAPVLTTLPPELPKTSAPGTNYTISYSTAPVTTEDNGAVVVPVVPVPVPVAAGAGVAGAGGVGGGLGGSGGGSGGDGGDDGGDDDSGDDSSKSSEPATSEPPKSTEPPESTQPTSASPSSSPSSSSSSSSFSSSVSPCSSRPPLSAPTGGDAVPDSDGLPQEIYDELAAEGLVVSNTTATIVVSSTTAPTLASTQAPAATSAPASSPVYCYNFNIKAYGYCCPGPDSPCENDLGNCYVGGDGVTGGASNVVPDGATCPPPANARLT